MAEDEDKALSTVKKILSEAKRQEHASNALAILFPKAEEVLKTYLQASSTENAWSRRRQRRISDKDFSAAYFRLDAQPATWSRSDIDKLLAEEEPDAAFEAVQHRLEATDPGDRPRLRRLFLEQLEAAFATAKKLTWKWLRAIIKASPYYLQEEDEIPTFLNMEDNEGRLRRVIFRGLSSISPEERANIFRVTAVDATDLSLLCDVFRAIEADLEPSGATKDRLTDLSFGDAAGSIREILVSKIYDLSYSRDIWAQARPSNLLWFLWGSGRATEVSSFTNIELSSPSGIRELFKLTITPVWSSSGNYERVANYWSRIVDIDQLAEIARNWLEATDTAENDRSLANRYLKAFAHKDDRGP